MTPGIPLNFPVESTSSLGATGKPVILSRRSGERTLISSVGGRKVAPLDLWWDPPCSPQMPTCMSGKFLSCSEGVKDPFEVQERRCDILETLKLRRASSYLEGKTSWFFMN